MFVAVTLRGVCRAAFMDFNSMEELLDDLHNDWPLSSIRESLASTRYAIDAFFSSDTASGQGPLSLHVTGTNFQIAVWRALLKIPPGAVASYAEVARSLGAPRSARAVGNAIGANPVALLIPCHRVIQQSGALGGIAIAGDQPRSLWYKHGKKCVMNRLRYNNAMQPTLVPRSADGGR